MPDTSLFPLPLVAFEQYMLADDRPDYPTNFFLRLGFAGVFDRPALQAAVDAAVERNPLLRACVRPRGSKRFEWVPAEHPEPPVSWQTNGGLAAFAGGQRIDLRLETGLRIYIAEAEGHSEMLLQFHHACCDGFGAVRFAEDLLAGYHNSVAGDSERIALPPLDLGRLRVRGKFGINPLGYVLRTHKEFVGALGTLQYFVLHPLPLVPRDAGLPDGPDSGERPVSSVCTFSVSETERLRRATKRMGCTVNDLLLRDLFLALHEWVAQHDPGSKGRWFRVMIPTNLRTPADAAMPAANVVGMVFNDRRPERFSSRDRLMSILRTEMKFCKRWRLGLSMIHVVRVARQFRGGLERLLRPDRCLATSVLSNLGVLDGMTVLPRRQQQIVAGNMTLEKVELLPPLRPMTHASFGAVSYAGRLTLSLTYDLHYFTHQGGQELLERFVRQLRSSVGEED